MIYAQLQQIDARTLRLIVALVCCVIVAGILLYVIKPQYVDFRDNHVAYDLLQNQIDDPLQLQASIDESQKRISDLQRQLHGEAGNMPVNEMEAYLVGRLQALAWDAGINLVGVRPGVARRIMEFEEISFEVDVTGEYNNLYRWLDRIGDALGFMLVTSYDISLSSRSASKTELSMHVTIVFYRSADR